MFLNILDYWYYIVIALVLVLLISLLFAKKKTKKVVVKTMANEMMDLIINSLGGVNNIESISSIGSRASVLVKNIGNVSLESLNENGASGVFVSGKNVKMLLNYKVDDFIEYVNSLL